MDKIAKYRESIKTLLTRYANNDTRDVDIEVQVIFDTEHDHYQWFNVGWKGFERIYQCLVHFDLKDGKIWLQQNVTEMNPADDLIAMGVARDDIILGLQPPYKRPYTDYGVA